MRSIGKMDTPSEIAPDQEGYSSGNTGNKQAKGLGKHHTPHPFRGGGGSPPRPAWSLRERMKSYKLNIRESFKNERRLMDAPLDYRLRECVWCHELIDTRLWGFYRMGTGWFKKQRKTQGTNSAALVDWSNRYACKFCIAKQVAGLNVDQMELFHMPYPDD